MTQILVDKAVIEQALEALIKANHFHDYEDEITALREALAEQAEQEPVAAYRDAPRTIYLQTGCDDPDPFECGCSFNEWGDVSWCAEKIHDTDIPYIRADYTRPVRTKDLTDDEIMKINVDTASIVPTCDRQFHFARAVIAAHKEKNK